MRSRLRLVIATAAVCTAAACQTPAPEGAKKDAPVVVATPDANPPASVDVKAADPGVAATAGAPANTGAATAPTTLDVAEPTPTGGDAGTAPPTTAGTEPTTPPVVVDKAKVLAEVKAKKTTDARAKKALEEAEAGGATVRELAEASNARGTALLGAGEAERAKAAFEWARDKDPTYPDASFNLAKQTANAGEIPETVAHLKEVHKRGGKTLLKQVGYDPTFEIVKDDPEVQKFVK